MTIRVLCILLIRLYAIIIFIRVIAQAPLIINIYQTQQSGFISSIFLSFILSIILWFFADIIADKVISGIDSSDKVIEFTLSEVQIMAISLIGLILLTHAIPELISQLIGYIKIRMKGFDIGTSDNLRIIQPILKTIIGFILLLGSRGIQGFITKSRETGLPKD